MKDQLEDFFSNTTFEELEPRAGHMHRFEQKLKTPQAKQTSWKWLSIAASILLLIGFSLGSINTNSTLQLSDVSPKMTEAESYFINAIHQDLRELESNRSISTERIIENALDELEELEDNYNLLLKDLQKSGEQRKIINAMINNYQNRLDILQRTLNQIEQLKNPNTVNNEVFI